MSGKKLVLIIEANQGYLHNDEEDTSFGERHRWLFSAITDTYIPLLNMLYRLEKDGIPFKLSIVISPVLCHLLSNPHLQDLYIKYLDSLIRLGKAEVKRCQSSPEMAQAISCLEVAEKTKEDFIETYGKNILSKIKHFSKSGYIELIPTSATFSYLPHYIEMNEAVNAQIETGLYSQHYFFGDSGEGFWLPYLGWGKGLEWNLRSYNRNYCIVDARSILFSKECPDKGIFSPVRTMNSLVLFGNDPDTIREISGEDGYIKNSVYRSQSHDIGFDLKQEDLASFFNKQNARFQTGYKYWKNGSTEGKLEPYIKKDAEEQAKKDAFSFYQAKKEKLLQAENLLSGEDAILVCSLSSDILGQIWHEGILWLETFIRLTNENKDFDLELCKNLLKNQFNLPKITPYPCSSNGLGYGEDLLNNSNSWMMRYVRKATQRMIDLAERFPGENSLKERLLNMASKQVLLAQSGKWPEMIQEGKSPEYVKELFTDEILSFSKVFDSLASSTVSTEWLTACEKKNIIFPWLNYRIFSKKK